MRSGIVYGHVGLVEGLVARLRAELPGGDRARVIAHGGFTRFGTVLSGDRIQRRAELQRLCLGPDSGGAKSRSVRLAGGYLLFEKPPVKRDRPLPPFEFCIERLPKAARPHLPGLLFAGHCYSLSLPLSRGISLPLLSVTRPALA